MLVIPQRTSTQLVSSNLTITQSSNQSFLATVAQPYTLTGTSTALVPMVQFSINATTVQTVLQQATLLSAATVYPQDITGAAAAMQTVTATVLSTSTLQPGQNDASILTVTSATTTLQASTVTANNTGGLLSTIRTFLFGSSTPLVVVPATITLPASQTPVITVVSQLVSMASLLPAPGVAQVVNIVSVAPTALSSAGKILTSTTILPSVVSNMVSTLTANNVVSVVTQQLTSVLTIKPTSTKVLNVGVPIVSGPTASVTTITRVSSTRTVAATTTTILTSTRTRAGKTTTLTASTRTKAGNTVTLPTNTRQRLFNQAARTRNACNVLNSLFALAIAAVLAVLA